MSGNKPQSAAAGSRRAISAAMFLCALLSTQVATAESLADSADKSRARALELYNEGVRLHSTDTDAASLKYRAALGILGHKTPEGQTLFAPDDLTVHALFNLALALGQSKSAQSREILLELPAFLNAPGTRGSVARLLEPVTKELRRTGAPREINRIIGKLRPRAALKTSAFTADPVTGLVPDEVAVLKGYLSAFQIERHTRAVRSRTYPGRQEDTVVLLRDLLTPDRKGERDQLATLRSLFAPAPERHRHGQGITFIDIGPAISNQWTPAITALALCSAFPRMNVIGLDLPDEVTTFLDRVSPEVQAEVTSYPNFHILSGDGTKSLRAQLAQRARLPLLDRPAPTLNAGAPIVVRTSNAIDIYFPWKVIGPTLAAMATDFADHPLLILFNRTILFKPRGSTQLRVIGRLSPRGFFHNALRLDAEGEPPYSLGGFFRAALSASQ